MKKPIHSILISVLLLALLPCILLAAAFHLPAYYQEAYYAELPAMVHRLQQAQGPRLIVIGGSNVAFGLNGEQLENTLSERGYSYTVCPLGLYAAVGTSAMLDLSAGELRQGDLVVLALEPTSETLSTYFGATAYLKCAESAPDLLLRVSRDKQAALIGNAIPFLQERWAIHTSGLPPKAEGVYAKASFNERCDLVYDRPGNAMALGYDTANPIDLAGLTIEDAFAVQLRDYCRLAAQRGANVVLSFCPVNRSALTDRSEAALQAYFDLLNTAVPCPVISDPHRYILDSGWFYDNNFHLNTAGALLRTQLLAEDILAYSGCYDLPEAADIKLPSSIYTAPQSAGDTDMFRYQPLMDESGAVIAYQVAGLTEAGVSCVELAVPAQAGGLPVVGIMVNAFSGADLLTQLTLPATIEVLPEHCFAGLNHLRHLVLLHTDKLCVIGRDTFDDTADLTLHVPAEAYSLYRDGQGCEENPWETMIDRIVPMQ